MEYFDRIGAREDSFGPRRPLLTPEEEVELMNSQARHPAGHFATKRLVEPPVPVSDTEPLA